MKNILITGATGFIGRYLLDDLLRFPQKVTAIVRKNSPNKIYLPQNDKLTVLEANIDDVEYIKQCLVGNKFDVCYHLAWTGMRGFSRDFDKSTQEKNYQDTINMLKLASYVGCETFISTGSQAEYGICNELITEDTTATPITEYGKNKLRAGREVLSLAKMYDIKCNWVRVFSVYGYGDNEQTLIMTALNKMLKNEALDLTECKQQWDYLYVRDAASVLTQLGERGCETGVYNLASGRSKPLREFILAMKNITRSKSVLKFGAVPYSDKGVVSLNPSIDKISKLVKLDGQVSFEKGIGEIIMEINNLNEIKIQG